MSEYGSIGNKMHIINKILIQLAVLWVTYAIGYHAITPHPFADWYGWPTFITLISVNVGAAVALFGRTK